jgi:hypothetical protein
MTDKDKLIDLVIAQIGVDAKNEDFTAIAELLECVPDHVLAGYLLEEDA